MNAQERTKVLEDKKEAQHDEAGAGATEKLWCKGDWRHFDIYRVPVEALLLNVDNRRFASDRVLVESMLGHSLDPENSSDDEKSVVSLLLDRHWKRDEGGERAEGRTTQAAEALKRDWMYRRQEKPFWIRPDGTVRNGNRRLAVIKRLEEEGGPNGFEYVDAILLDPGEIDEEDLFKMEQREQLTEDFKVRYTDVNLLLALRAAAVLEDIDWGDEESLRDVATQIQPLADGDEKYAIVQLRAIKYMDAFLDDLGRPGEYYRLYRQVERFRDVGRLMARVESDYPDDAVDVLRLAFAAVKAGNPHGDIRILREIIQADKESYRELLENIVKLEDASEAEPVLEMPDVGAAPEEDDDDETKDAEAGSSVVNYPKEEVSKEIKNAVDGFKARSLDIKDQLVQAMSRLELISEEMLATALEGPTGNEIKVAALDILNWGEAVRPHVENE